MQQNFTSDNIFLMAREKSISEKNHLFKTMYMDEDDDWPEFFNNMLKVNAFFVPPINVMSKLQEYRTLIFKIHNLFNKIALNMNFINVLIREF